MKSRLKRSKGQTESFELFDNLISRSFLFYLGYKAYVPKQEQDNGWALGSYVVAFDPTF